MPDDKKKSLAIGQVLFYNNGFTPDIIVGFVPESDKVILKELMYGTRYVVCDLFLKRFEDEKD